ncbi:MAG: FliM/FliN family flagellar motor switch protein [Planctomycetes bacterium]|nr:FliM/FliN family flagellar motor switch protein [Planctomycetota bacterium]
MDKVENVPVEEVSLESILRKVQGVPGAAGAVFEALGPSGSSADADGRRPRPELLKGVHLKVRAELGRAHLSLKEALQLAPGSVVDLEKLADDPVDLYVNDLLVARGEVLVVNDCYCVRITEVFSSAGEEEKP